MPPARTTGEAGLRRSAGGWAFSYSHYPDYGDRGDVTVEEWMNTNGGFEQPRIAPDSDQAQYHGGSGPGRAMALFLQRYLLQEAAAGIAAAYARYLPG